MPQQRLINVLTAKLKRKFPLPVNTYFNTSVECVLDIECISIFSTLRSLVSCNEFFGPFIIQKLLNLGTEVLQVIDSSDNNNLVAFTNLVILLDIIADFLFYRWYHQQKQPNLLPLPNNMPEPLPVTLAESILFWLRKCVSLQLTSSHNTVAFASTYFPINTTDLCTDSNIITNKTYISIDISASLFKSVGRVCFIISASNWSTFQHEIEMKLLRDVDVPDQSMTNLATASAPNLTSSNTRTPLMTTLFLIQYGLFNITRLRSFIHHFAFKLQSIKKERRWMIYQVTHHLIWSWIDLHQGEFENLMVCADLPDNVSLLLVYELESLFESIVTREEDLKKKHNVWPILFLIAVLIKDKGKEVGCKTAHTNTLISSIKVNSNMAWIEKRISVVNMIMKSIRKYESGHKLDALPTVLLDLLKLRELVLDSSAKLYMNELVSEAGLIGKVIAKEIGTTLSGTNTGSVPQIISAEYIAMVVFQQAGFQVMEEWRHTCDGNDMQRLSLICNALVRYKYLSIRQARDHPLISQEILKSIDQYIKPFIITFINDDDELTEAKPHSSRSKLKTSNSEWKASNFPFTDILQMLQTHMDITEDPVMIEFLYQVILRCVRPIQHMAIQILQSVTLLTTNRVTAMAVTNVLINMERVIIRSEDTDLQAHGVELFEHIFKLHALHSVSNKSDTDSGESGLWAADQVTLNWNSINMDLETMVLICLVSSNDVVVKATLKCLCAVIHWNSVSRHALFSSSANRLIYSKWQSTELSYKQFLLGLREMEPTPGINAAVECAELMAIPVYHQAIEILRKDYNVDRNRMLSFIFAAASDPSSDILMKSYKSGILTGIPSSVYTCVHPNNLACAYLTFPDNVTLFGDSEIHAIISAMLVHDLNRVVNNLSALVTSLLPKVSDANVSVLVQLIIRIFNRCWWDTPILDLLVEKLVHWIDVVELKDSCMEILYNVCQVTRFFFPTTLPGRTSLQKLLPHIFSSEPHSLLALKFDHIADYLIAYSHHKRPSSWMVSVFETLGGQEGAVHKVPSVADLLCSDVVCALNLVVPATELDSVSGTLYRFALSQDRVEDIVCWLTQVELDGTSQPQTFLRSTVFAVKLASLAVRDSGEGLILAAQAPLINVPDELIELDAVKDPRHSGFKRLEALCESVIESVLGSAHTVGPRLRTILKTVADVMETKFPEYRLVGVGNLVFLRLICPSLMSMQVPLNLRARTLIAKVIQNTVNGVYFGGKEEHMAHMNSFVAKYLPLITPFLEGLCHALPVGKFQPDFSTKSQPVGHLENSSSFQQGLARPTHSPKGSIASLATLNRPQFHGALDLKYLNILTKYRDNLMTYMLPTQRDNLVRILNGILPLRSYPYPLLDLGGLPEVLACSESSSDKLLPSNRWFVGAGVSRANHLPVFTLSLQNIPLYMQTSAILASMYYELRHAPSIPIVLVIDSSFSVPSLTISELITQFISDCYSLIDKVVILFCIDHLLSVFDSLPRTPTVVLAGKLETFQEHVPVDVLMISRQVLLADLVAKPAHLTIMPVGQLQLAGVHVIFSYHSHGKTVHELYHISQLAVVRAKSVSPSPHGVLYSPSNNRLLIFRLTNPTRSATNVNTSEGTFLDLVSIITQRQASTVTDNESCRPLRTEFYPEEHPAKLLLQAMTQSVSEIHKVDSETFLSDKGWLFILQELCAHIILASDPKEKLMYANRFCEFVIPNSPINLWGSPLVNSLLFLDMYDPTVAEILHRQLANSPHSPAILKFLLDLNDPGHGLEFTQLYEKVIENHVRLMSTQYEYGPLHLSLLAFLSIYKTDYITTFTFVAHERIVLDLHALLRDPRPNIKSICHNARTLHSVLSARPTILSYPKPHIIWTLYVLSKIPEIPDITRNNMTNALWHERPTREWASFALEFRLAIMSICHENLERDSSVFLPSLQLFIEIKSVEASLSFPVNAIDGHLFDVLLHVLCDRASTGSNVDITNEILGLVQVMTDSIKYIDADTVRTDGTKVIPQLVGLGLALLGIYGCDDYGPNANMPDKRLIQSSVQLTVQALQAMDVHGLLIEKPLEKVMNVELPGMMEAFDNLFGVSTTTCFSVAVGLILARVKLSCRIYLEPLIRGFINLSQNVSIRSPYELSNNNTHTGYLFPIIGSRELATKLLPRSQDPGVVLFQLQLSSRTLMLLSAHLLQVMDEATTQELGDTVQWVIEWIKAVYTESPAIFSLILDPYTECVERLITLNNTWSMPSRESSYQLKPNKHVSSNKLTKSTSSLSLSSSQNVLRPRSSTTIFFGDKDLGMDSVLNEATWNACDLLSTLLLDQDLVSRAKLILGDKTLKSPESHSSILPNSPKTILPGDSNTGVLGLNLGLPPSMPVTSLKHVLEYLQFPCLLKDKQPNTTKPASRGDMLAVLLAAETHLESPTTPTNMKFSQSAWNVPIGPPQDRPRGTVPS